MASTGVNVLRYSALGLGVLYGAYHQMSLTAASKVAAAKRDYEHKQSLINQAKAEYTRKTSPPSNDVIRDPSDKNFDLEKLLIAVSKES